MPAMKSASIRSIAVIASSQRTKSAMPNSPWASAPRSTPVEKARPSPVMTTTRTAGRAPIVAGAFGGARMTADIPIGLFLTHHLRRAVVIGPCVLAVGAAFLTSGGPFPILVLGRLLMGVGHALGIVAGLTAILHYRTGLRLASALNAYEFSAMIGILCGTVLIGVLPSSLAWNWALLVTCAPQLIGLLALPALLRALPRHPGPGPKPLFARQAATGPDARAASITPT